MLLTYNLYVSKACKAHIKLALPLSDLNSTSAAIFANLTCQEPVGLQAVHLSLTYTWAQTIKQNPSCWTVPHCNRHVTAWFCNFCVETLSTLTVTAVNEAHAPALLHLLTVLRAMSTLQYSRRCTYAPLMCATSDNARSS